ncbi:MAG: outer membrane lipoprotein chaperone LolA [Cycloclasticus sp.]|nr:outer membrane lipoprotein chaperone LolA [Cycloclasticus sp.]MBQ0789961.1 outer membrane lipoprotein chaperone LolA [Cycloclasticus sp.]
MNFYRISLALLITVCQPIFASDDAQNLQNQLDKYTQLSGHFTQIISNEQGSQTQSSTGEFWVKKPNQFRWNYQLPYVQKIVSNGDKLWIYDEDLEQVSIKAASKAIDSSPLSIILGSTNLEQLFKVTKLADKDGIDWIKLTPITDNSGFDYIDIGFNAGVLNRMVLRDSFGQTTRLLFTAVAVNTLIEDELFTFVVPEGADVFEELAE